MKKVDHLEKSYNLHWADVDYSMKPTEAQPVDLGSDEQRLDVVFTDKGIDKSGCWVAIPIALTNPSIVNHA
jgi:hypothetical protein